MFVSLSLYVTNVTILLSTFRCYVNFSSEYASSLECQYAKKGWRLPYSVLLHHAKYISETNGRFSSDDDGSLIILFLAFSNLSFCK